MLVASAAVLVVAIGALFVLAAQGPDVLLIQRSISIAAPAERVFALIADFHCCSAWAPQDQHAPSGAATMVTVTCRGQQPVSLKVMGVFLDMDRQFGAHFERGLKALKAAAGDDAKAAAAAKSPHRPPHQM